MEIGSKLRSARNERGITQEQAAELLGVSRQTISNWENNRSYPDIISVIKMSDFYSVSLDHLLKEDNSMNKNYQQYLEESTNMVKAKNNLGKIIILATYFIVWITAMILLWNVNGVTTNGLNLTLKWIVLPLLLLWGSITISKLDYWGKGKWFCIVGAAVTFLTIPYTQFLMDQETGIATFTFRFPNFVYMLIGVVISSCGLGIGRLWSRVTSRQKSEG